MNPQSLTIPLRNITTALQLPYTIYSTDLYDVVLKKMTNDHIRAMFGIKTSSITKDKETFEVLPNIPDSYTDHSMSDFMLHSKLQIYITPRNGLIDEELRERMSLALECSLGFYDRYAAWIYPSSTSIIASPGSHKNTRKNDSLGADEVRIIQSILQYQPSEYLPEHKFNTLRALLNSARHQATAPDVACVLYFSILEAIYVNDDKELSYKLSMRIAKKMNKDYDFAKSLIRLYSKRGKVIHGAQKGKVFLNDDISLIEALAKKSLVDFINSPDDYTPEALDRILIE